MNEKIQLGVVNTLRIDRTSDHGFYLVSEDGDDVLLPKAYVTEDMNIEDEIDVFIYNDSEDRYVATTERPGAMLGEFGYFEVVGVESFGAFVDWGLQKDLFIPKKFQKIPLEVGMKFVFRVCIDEDTDRLIGAHKFKSFIHTDVEELQENQKVNIIIREKTPLGFKVIVDNKYEAMIFHNEIFEDIWIGQKKVAYIKKIRPDKKMDISLRPIGKSKENEETAIHRVTKVLKANGGELECTYKSDPELIKELFGLSKKNYKKALTKLIEDKIIKLDEDGITLA
ncbi:CvfB family protein [Sulfurospirillum arcachonense]|uniref:CvfB family protein n=1 Tax=Sulfurospirillum arcachonense TaxID=57666 RepID=UPI00046928A5|nr:S1-like domain-containing RNA-binding protein [Sulfurospirillum arcachonense]